MGVIPLSAGKGPNGAAGAEGTPAAASHPYGALSRVTEGLEQCPDTDLPRDRAGKREWDATVRVSADPSAAEMAPPGIDLPRMTPGKTLTFEIWPDVDTGSLTSNAAKSRCCVARADRAVTLDETMRQTGMPKPVNFVSATDRALPAQPARQRRVVSCLLAQSGSPGASNRRRIL